MLVVASNDVSYWVFDCCVASICTSKWCLYRFFELYLEWALYALQQSYETPVLVSLEKSSLPGPPKDGVYVSGIFLEGATWNFQAGILEESRPMELLSSMPIIHFKPVEGKRKALKGYYTCPLYMYPVRSGSRERPSYVVSVDLKAGKGASDFWTKRGVALLLSTGF